MNFINLYVWIPESYYSWWPLGMVFAACVVLFVAVLIHRSAAPITTELTIFLATYSVLVVPYMLPKMHDRYYFPADVFAIILAFYSPRHWYVPVVIGAVSVFLYVRHLNPHLKKLFGYDGPLIPDVPLELLAFVPTLLIVALSWQLYMKLKPKQQASAAS